METCLQPEEYAYPNGGMTRKGRALCSDGKIRTVRAGIPNTWFSIPAYARIKGKYCGGYLTMSRTGEYLFHAAKKYRDALNIPEHKSEW